MTCPIREFVCNNSTKLYESIIKLEKEIWEGRDILSKEVLDKKVKTLKILWTTTIVINEYKLPKLPDGCVFFKYVGVSYNVVEWSKLAIEKYGKDINLDPPFDS